MKDLIKFHNSSINFKIKPRNSKKLLKTLMR